MDIINGYQPLEKIGEGAFGETWLAKKIDAESNRWSGERVVIKKLKLNQVDHWKAIERFHREGMLMKQLDHPGLPAYIDFIEEPDFTGIVQEHITGLPLNQIIKARPHYLTRSLIESIIRQGLEILHYLETLSPPIIHRDISPKNFLLDSHDRLHLIDFGSVQKSYSDTITTMGTFGYMAPEQLRGKATTQSDLFSFGMVLLSLITRKPIESLPVNALTGKISTRILLEYQPKVIRKIVSGLVEPGTGKRFKTALEALKLFDQIKTPETTKTDLECHHLSNGELIIQWLTPEEEPLFDTLAGFQRYDHLFSTLSFLSDSQFEITKSCRRILLFFMGPGTLIPILMYDLWGLIIYPILFLLDRFIFDQEEYEESYRRSSPLVLLIMILLIVPASYSSTSGYLLLLPALIYLSFIALFVPATQFFNHYTLRFTRNKTALTINHSKEILWNKVPQVQMVQRRKDLFHINIILGQDSYFVGKADHLESALALKKSFIEQLNPLFNNKIQEFQGESTR